MFEMWHGQCKEQWILKQFGFHFLETQSHMTSGSDLCAGHILKWTMPQNTSLTPGLKCHSVR